MRRTKTNKVIAVTEKRQRKREEGALNSARSLVGFSFASWNLCTELMTAHQPPTQQAVLIQKQLSHGKLTSITGKCFSTTLNCICTHRPVADYLCVCVRQTEVQSVWVWPASRLCAAYHHSETKWIHHSVAVQGTRQLVSIMLQEAQPPILVSWRRIICMERGVKREWELSSFASSTDGSLLGVSRGPESLNEQKHRYPDLTHEIIIKGINSTSQRAFILWSI